MRVGVFVSTQGRGAPVPVDEVARRFERAEAGGLATAWVGQVFEYDALTLLALACRATRRIELGTWVVPSYPRHPSSLALQALTVQAASGGRLVLGIGVSHRAVVEKRLGLDYSRPLRHMREYLSALVPLLAGELAKLQGKEVRVALQLQKPEGVAPPPVLLAALGPRMLELAGSRADGAAIWLGGPRYLEGFAIPRLLRAAREAGRPTPRIVAGLPVAVVRDAEAARDSAEHFLARSSSLPAYRAVLEREGVATPGGVAILGDESHVERELDRLAALGVTDLNAITFSVGGEPDSLERTLAFLGERSREARERPAS